jgi:hypothetical protein
MRRFIGITLALLMLPGSLTTVADEPAAERFSFARPPAPESTVDPKDNRLPIVIDRWASDAERDSVVTSIAENGEARLLTATRDLPRAGRILWPGGLEYTIHYARRQTRPDGGADIVLVVDRPLWMWWDSKLGTTDYPFSIVQLQLDKDGKGEGRVSLNTPVTRDKALGVALSDYAKAPAVLTDVRRHGTGG